MKKRFEGSAIKLAQASELGRTTISSPAEHSSTHSNAMDGLPLHLIQKGDIILVAENFGDSGEEIPRALKELEVACVIAPSFTRSFYRNSINLGLPLIESCEAFDSISDREMISINFDKGEIYCTKGILYFPPFQDTIARILAFGGLIPYAKKSLGK